jgi:hypothetical protein
MANSGFMDFCTAHKLLTLWGGLLIMLSGGLLIIGLGTAVIGRAPAVAAPTAAVVRQMEETWALSKQISASCRTNWVAGCNVMSSLIPKVQACNDEMKNTHASGFACGVLADATKRAAEELR